MSPHVMMEVKGLEVLVKLFNPQTPPVILERVVQKAAWIVKDRVRQFIPVRTGRLLETVEMEKISPVYIIVTSGGSEAPYAPFVAFGTRPHIILPREASALRFEIDGEVIFAKRVMHPGYVGSQYPRLAIEYAVEDFHTFLADEVAEVIRA